jgi:hypothetical protein
VKSKNDIENQQTLSFVDYVIEIYNSLQSSTLENINLAGHFIYESFFSSLYQNFSINELKNKYRDGIANTINKRLGFFNEAIQKLRTLEEVNYYENSISIYTSFFVFWILENEIEMTREDMEKLCDAIYTGTIGYRLLDLNQDHNIIGQEALMLGYFLINSYEEILSEIFPFPDTLKIIKKYAKLYSEVEYEEKRNRWKECPFTWNEVYKLGHKASPVFSIFELLFKSKGYSEEKIRSIIEGIIYVITTTQMCDDIVDAKEDLTNGFETLVMSGFYKTHGLTDNINDEKIAEFLTSERVKKFYETNIHLFNITRKIFTENNEYTLLLLMELKYYQFVDSFYIES